MMKRLILIINIFLTSSPFLFCQEQIAFLEAAQKRYPSMKVCELPQIQSQGLCGTIMVFEDYQRNSGKMIPIEVIVLPALTDHPLSSVFTYHWGGNGDAARNKVSKFREGGSAYGIRFLQDVMVMDDRGTGASNIRCAAMDSLKPYSYAFVYDKNRIQQCLEEVSKNYNLDLYNTPGVVADIEFIRDQLKIRQFDFYGASYGVRVGLEYMRQHPKRLHTIIFHGSVPPGFDYINEMDISIQEQLDVLFNRCAKDSVCSAYYPNFRQELYQVRDRLSRSPEKIIYELEDGQTIEIEMTDELFQRIIGHHILNGDANEALPFLVHRAFTGNYTPLIVRGGSLKLDMPVFLSQFCPEEVDRFLFQPEHFGAEDLFTKGVIGLEKINACTWWKKMPKAKWLDEPLQSSCPILLFTGQNDANTPVRMGEQIRAQFPESSRHFRLPHEGHAGGAANKCRDQLMIDFIRSGDILALDTSCLNGVQSRKFSFEKLLSEDTIKQFEGSFRSTDSTKFVRTYYKNGSFYMEDEFAEYFGPSILLYKGEEVFQLLDCDFCKLKFRTDSGRVTEVQRMYRDTVILKQ